MEIMRAKLMSLSVYKNILETEPVQALLREAKRMTAEMAELIPSLTPELKKAADEIADPGAFADFTAANILVRQEDKQAILEQYDITQRLQELVALLGEETELLRCEMEIHKEVREHLARNQKEYYLREQIRVIEE